MRTIVSALLMLYLLPYSFSQSNDCPTAINGALKGGPGNIQDHMFHSLAIDPSNENIVYVGTETNGIFKTTDGGATWIRSRQGLKCTAQKTGYSQIFDIAIDPNDSRVVFAATVNGPGPPDNPINPSASGGIYKSTDGGLSWMQKNQGFTNTYASYVLIDSTNPRRIYAGIGGVKSTFQSQNKFYEGGIWASDDGADSWSPMALPPGVSTNILIDMVLRGVNQKTIYASGQLHGTDATAAYGLVRSTDAGQTWKIVNPSGVTIYGFDSFMQDPTILYGHDDSTGRRVHRSVDGGNSWTEPQASFFGVVRIHPSNSQIVIYTGRTSLLKSKDGFATSRETYNDTELNQNQQMVDVKISQSNPNVVWACAKGYYLYKSTDGGESFTKFRAVREMIYGSAVSTVAPTVFNTVTSQTGIALINSGTSAVSVTLSPYDDSGAPAVVNPITASIPARGQWSRVISEIFPGLTGLSGAWLKVTASQPGVSGFYLNFDPALRTMDGTNLTTRFYTDWILTELRDAEIAFLSPDQKLTADATVSLVNEQGSDQARSQPIRIPAGGRLVIKTKDLFAAALLDAGGYIRVSATQAIVVSEQFGAVGRDGGMLHGLYHDGGARILYAPQFVAGGGYKSAVTLVNLEETATKVNIAWKDNAGVNRGTPSTIDLPGRGSRTITDPGFFGVTPPASGLDGYLVANSSATLIAGSVRFGDAADAGFQASLPLQSTPSTETLYAHVAQDSTFFTGVAIVNTNSDAANVTVSIYDSEGTQVGGGMRTIPGNGRISELLSQIAPSLRALSRGYFTVSSDRAVLSFSVFGTHTLSVLAAIPSQ